MKKQTVLTMITIFIIVGLMGLIVIAGQSPDGKAKSNTNQNSESVDLTDDKIYNDTIVIFYGSACPFCKDVDNWIEANQAEEYLEIVYKEVSNNRVNAQELMKVAAACGRHNSQGVGVPFLYADGQCYSGKFEIIEYLDQQLSLAQQLEEEGEIKGIEGEINE